jgi:hypothetical protein
VIFIELARSISKKPYKTMVCKAFSFHERFHPSKMASTCGGATIENAFRAMHKMEKDMQIQAIPQSS